MRYILGTIYIDANFCTEVGLTFVGSVVTSSVPDALAEEKPEFRNAPAAEIKRFNRCPRMLHDCYIHRVREVEQCANARRATWRAKADAKRYVADVRERPQECFGPFPEKTLPNPVVAWVRKREE